VPNVKISLKSDLIKVSKRASTESETHQHDLSFRKEKLAGIRGGFKKWH
jgi:hypothetical protein